MNSAFKPVASTRVIQIIKAYAWVQCCFLLIIHVESEHIVWSSQRIIYTLKWFATFIEFTECQQYKSKHI